MGRVVTSGCLYCVGGCDLCRKITTAPAWFKGRSVKGSAGVKLRRVLAGFHPFGFRLGPADKACGDCRHFSRTEYHDAKYAKCAIVGGSRSASSDGSATWRACEKFAQAEAAP